jgi:ribonuclease I
MKLLAVICMVFALPVFPQQPGKAGQFDYYLLVLSWSPEFCHGKPAAANAKIIAASSCMASGRNTTTAHTR